MAVNGIPEDLWAQLVQDEDRKVLYLQGIVDTSVLKIMNARITRQEALNLVLRVRGLACELFPDSMATFDLIYMSRFKRVIDEFALPDPE